MTLGERVRSSAIHVSRAGFSYGAGVAAHQRTKISAHQKFFYCTRAVMSSITNILLLAALALIALVSGTLAFRAPGALDKNPIQDTQAIELAPTAPPTENS